MTTSVQSVIKKISKVISKVPKKIALHVTLLLTTRDRKNYASMARDNNVSYKKVYIENGDANSYTEECIKYLREGIKALSTKENPGILIIDFTLLEKHFSTKIPGITYDYDNSRKRTEKGFSAGFMFWSNGSVTIPCDFAL